MNNKRHNVGERMKRKGEAGFTLLLAALVASITLALGTAIYSIAVKQVQLASIGRESQFAFYTADTIAECALFWDVRYDYFSTTSPPSSVTCNNVTVPVTAVNDQNTFANGSCWYYSTGGDGGSSSCPAGSFTFTIPANSGGLYVEVRGAGGGGGGGSDSFTAGTRGNSGSTYTSYNFDPLNPVGYVIATAGTYGTGAGRGSSSPGSPGSPGSAAGGDVNTAGGGSTGGSGGPAGSGGSKGGNGGNGGYANKTYSAASLPPTGTAIPITVGAGGSGGAGGGSGGAGLNGTGGSIHITWTGDAGVWTKTTFTFQMPYNDECANVTLTKEKNGNSVAATIHADGFNVICSAINTDPHSLQRAVELHY